MQRPSEEYGFLEVKSFTHSFTTERKHKRRSTIDIARKGSIVKERCRQLTEILLTLYPDRRISNEDLAYYIQRYIGGDKETIRAYMGYQGTAQRSTRTGEGYIRGRERKGYLEIFDFMHRINPYEWIIHAQATLPIAETQPNTNEGIGIEFSKEKISISLNINPSQDNESLTHEGLKEKVSVGETSVSPRTERPQRPNEQERGDMGGETNNNNNTTEREKFYSKDYAFRHTRYAWKTNSRRGNLKR